ncbi:MAG: 2-C-methyl-D-erythritol 4-phosphate cytidylyltransferase, partial [Bdellovibrionales bacterium]|nr:2-C-methyl-D-erythritol 4-phosphate cytidylyltransferase [Bdellovibrionales bacterium]
ATRQDSVHKGLKAIDEQGLTCNYVSIHDAARCLITPKVIDESILACLDCDGAIVAEPVRDTLKKVNHTTILKTVSRENLWAMQTPQVFKFPLIFKAYQNAYKKGLKATDDAQLAEFEGGSIQVVRGDVSNIKITYPEDMTFAETLLKSRYEID